MVKAAFVVVAFVAVSGTALGSYEFLFRPVDSSRLVSAQLNRYTEIVLSQQVTGGPDDGGFRLAQGGVSNDAQVWTTAQCLVAIFQQDAKILPGAAADLRRSFRYIERLRLKAPDEGWGYVRDFSWGVTEIDAWTALAYLYSLRGDSARAIWRSDELPGAILRTQQTLDVLVRRQHDDGGWSPIEKTGNSQHLRTYSTVMAVWALAEAEENGDVVVGHEDEYRAALVSGAKWLLASYVTTEKGISGWWSNPSSKIWTGSFPGLTAQALFALSEAKLSQAFIGADPKFKDAVASFIRSSLEGNEASQPVYSHSMADNDRVHDSDRYLPGRAETAEASAFLWYPWMIAAATALEHDPLLEGYQQERLRGLLSLLLARSKEVDTFVRNDQAIYPTAEVLFAGGYYFSKDRLAIVQRP